jgi:hypothetical protein
MKRKLHQLALGVAGVAVLAGAALVIAATNTPPPRVAPVAAKLAQAQPGPEKKPEQPKDLPKPGLNLTVYESFALVKDRRELPDVFKAGVNVIQFRDVAATLDATSVHFRSLTDPEAQVLEQNYEFDLVGADKLLQKYIDQKITAHLRDGKSYEGTLLSYDDHRLVLAGDKDKGPIFVVERGDNIKRIQFSKLPEGLLTRPTLVWAVNAKKAGKHLVEVSYIANAIRWRADYNVVLTGDDKHVNLSGWVTIENNTGVAFPQARVKLLAGDMSTDIDRTQWSSAPDYYKVVSTLPPSDKAGPDVSQRIGDFRLFQVPEATTIANNQIKQIELIRASQVPVTKTYLYDGAKVEWYRWQTYTEAGFGADCNKKVNVLVEMQNRQDQNLGISLPRGKMRAYKQDADGAMEFIGEDLVPHTSRNEKVVLYLGDAFDIVGERKQTSFRRIDKHTIIEEFEIKVRNHKKEAVTVKVLEKLYRCSEWRLFNNTQPFVQLDSRTVVFPVDVPADKEATVRYQVEYRF